MKGLKVLVFVLGISLFLTGCGSSNKVEVKSKGKYESIINIGEYTNPLICKKESKTDYNTILDYLVYDYDKEGKNVLKYSEIVTYNYSEDQSTENKDRYAKWYDCSNFNNNQRISSCSSSWVNDKTFKITKEFTDSVISNLQGISLEEIKSEPTKGYTCE